MNEPRRMNAPVWKSSIKSTQFCWPYDKVEAVRK
jgi:hypothetical protein